jgi:predicted ATP-dependent serine protease
MVNQVTLWVCDKCDTHPATFCHECFGCGAFMKPVEFTRRPTKRAVDEGDSAPLQAESTPEVLSIEEADTTPALRN